MHQYKGDGLVKCFQAIKITIHQAEMAHMTPSHSQEAKRKTADLNWIKWDAKTGTEDKSHSLGSSGCHAPERTQQIPGRCCSGLDHWNGVVVLLALLSAQVMLIRLSLHLHLPMQNLKAFNRWEKCYIVAAVSQRCWLQSSCLCAGLVWTCLQPDLSATWSPYSLPACAEGLADQTSHSPVLLPCN